MGVQRQRHEHLRYFTLGGAANWVKAPRSGVRSSSINCLSVSARPWSAARPTKKPTMVLQASAFWPLDRQSLPGLAWYTCTGNAVPQHPAGQCAGLAFQGPYQMPVDCAPNALPPEVLPLADSQRTGPPSQVSTCWAYWRTISRWPMSWLLARCRARP
jgi:hypothetical protein